MARGVGATLQSLGQGVQQDAMSTLGAAAEQESRRSMQNQQIEQQKKAGQVQLGSTLGALGGFYAGAQAGSVGGPLGALIGGTVGAIAGGLFD
ncbi:MAG: bacteriocin [Proteobacteria bacterium]|nr:bacteriocin [Pseudomonadota bacterium]